MKSMAIGNFKRYESPEQYAEAFQQMIDARERWRMTVSTTSGSMTTPAVTR